MKKTLVALLLAVVMLATCVPALAVEGPNQDMSIFPLTDEKITITMVHRYTDVMPADWTTVWFWKQLEDLTNVHVEFTPVPSSDRATKLNLLFGAPETMPDVLFIDGGAEHASAACGAKARSFHNIAAHPSGVMTE